MPTKVFKMADIKMTEANRDIVPQQVERLKESIRKYGYLEGMPIVVDEDGFIIDGQHRYMACKELKIEPPIIQAASFDIVPIINSTQLKWTMKDFVKYFAEKGYAHYVVLRALCKAKNISPATAYSLIFNKAPDRTGISRTHKLANPLKDGTFQFPDISEKGLAKIERKIDAILALVSKLGLPRTDRLLIAIARLAADKNFSFSVMNQKIDFQRARVYRCATIQEYMQMLANIYNYKNTKKVAV